MKVKDKLSGCILRVVDILDNPTGLVKDDEGYDNYRKLSELEIINQSIGMNDGVRVKLTRVGAELLNEQQIPVQHGCKKDRWCVGDEYSAQLWWLMHVFGRYCSAGQDILFSKLETV